MEITDPGLVERFYGYAQPEPNTGCWMWTAYVTPKGYGRVMVGKRSYQAHRYSWLLHRGDIPDGWCVCHKCDTPWCVNPDHLFLGTVDDNNQDMFRKGRAAPVPRLRGASNPKARLTDASVKDIRELYATGTWTQMDLAAKYGVSTTAVFNVIAGRTWVYV